MEPATSIAHALDQLPLDEAVHVLVRSGHPRRILAAVLEDLLERRHDRVRVGPGQHASGGECLCPREAADHVIFEEMTVEAKGNAEIERRRIGSRVETA